MTESVPWPKVKRALVAILRGVRPGEAETIVGTPIDNGFELIEVPLNSPEPFHSIGRLSRRFGKHCLIGAGTVLSAAGALVSVGAYDQALEETTGPAESAGRDVPSSA
jgi:2-dehydro-3-deoxyphosphogalactonate aldolase